MKVVRRVFSPAKTRVGIASLHVLLVAAFSCGETPQSSPASPLAAELSEAVFEFSCADLTCSFDNTSSDSDGSIVASQWDFGDGSNSASTNPEHTYGTSGQYIVSLEVTDDEGGATTVSHTVEVTSPPPPPSESEYDVAIEPGESIQGVVDANPAGTVYLIKAGVHRRQNVKPKTGDKFIGEDGAVLDGENITKYAFEGYSSTHDVEIRNLIVEHYVPDDQQGAIRVGHYWDWPEFNAPGWTIADCEIRYNSTGGISTAPQIVIVGNRIHHNGQAGILGYGDGILIEGNEVSHNNYESAFNTWWEAGGMKLKRTRDLVVSGNHVHHNTGRGIWTDIDNVNVLIEDNLVEDNTLAGIFHEISYDAVIRNNTVLRNALSDPNAESWLWGSGILVSNSPNVEVTGNHVEGNANGIGVIEQDRGHGAYGPWIVENLNVHDNTIIMDRGWTGIVQDTGDPSVFRDRGNHFEGNTYHLRGGSRRFRWEANQRTEQEWRTYGNDVNGSFSF